MKTFAASLLALAACYGEGPPGQTPGDITVIFHTEIPGSTDYCGNAHYLASVAISPDGTAYAIDLPFRPIDGNCNDNGGNGGMGGTLGGTATVYSGDKMGDPQQVASTFTAMGGGTFGHPHVSRFGNYLHQDPASMSGAGLIIGPSATLLPQSQMPASFPAGFVDDGITMWVAAVQAMTNSAPELEDPTFPTSQMPGGVQSNYFARISYDGSQTAVMPISPAGTLAVDEIRNSLADSSPNLYFMTIEPMNGRMLDVWSFPKFSATPGDLVKIWSAPLVGTTLPMGIAADDAHVVWSVSTDWRGGDLDHTCQVYSYDIAAATTTKLLDTSNFSCMDIALDATSAYFAIGAIEYYSGQTGTGELTGKGMGRVGFDGTVATLDMKITGVSRGPRRVFSDFKHLYFQDPLVFAKIAKEILDSPLDFPP